MHIRPRMTDFGKWLASMGYHRNQIAEAALLIGLKATSASNTYTGKRELTEVERLAMSALRVGLKPWTPEYDGELQAMAPACDQASAA